MTQCSLKSCKACPVGLQPTGLTRGAGRGACRPSRNRRNRRGVKRKMSNYPIRRKTDRTLPAINIAEAIQIVK